MALMYLGIKLCGVTVMLSIICPTGSQEIFFELKDRQFQEIIFNGDLTVVMVCKINAVKTAEVKIAKSGGEVVATNNGEGNCLEFVISRINSTENLNYTCSVSYKSGVDATLITQTKTMILNVSNRDQSCFRNGTGPNQPYRTGDVLLLSCYCRITELCGWTETAVGSMLGKPITPFEERVYNNNKKITRIIVGPFNDTGIMRLRYDCSGGTTVEERCSIGPAQESAGDIIINPTNLSVGSLECPATEVSTEHEQTFSSTEQGKTFSSSEQGKTFSSTEQGQTFSSTEHGQTFSSTKHEQTFFSSEGGTLITAMDLTTTSSTNKPSLVMVNLPAKENDESFLTFIIVLVGICALLIVSLVFILFFIVLKRKKKDTKTPEEGHEIDNLHQSVDNLDQSSEDLDENVDDEDQNVDDDDQNTDDEEDQNVEIQDQNVDIQDQIVDVHANVGNVADDLTDLSEQSHVSDEDVVATDVSDGRDTERFQGSLVPLPVDNNGSDHDDVEGPEDQFQTAETSDYSLLVAFMKNNMQNEQDEVFGLDAEEGNLNKPE